MARPCNLIPTYRLHNRLVAVMLKKRFLCQFFVPNSPQWS